MLQVKQDLQIVCQSTAEFLRVITIDQNHAPAEDRPDLPSGVPSAISTEVLLNEIDALRGY